MGNWCDNNMEITGSKDEIARLHAALLRGDFLASIQPEPADADGDWWDSNWGTSSDVCDENALLSEDGTTLTCYFEAPQPLLPIYERLVSVGFGVKATYYSGDGGYYGRWVDGVDDSDEIPEMKTEADFDRWTATLHEDLDYVAEHESECFEVRSDSDEEPAVIALD
jgi:hypothetical protein